MPQALRASLASLLLLGPTALAFFAGGYFDTPRLIAGIVVWLVVAAAVFCEEQGGTTSGPEPMCNLPDGSVVDAWEYFRTEGP